MLPRGRFLSAHLVTSKSVFQTKMTIYCGLYFVDHKGTWSMVSVAGLCTVLAKDQL